MCAAEHGLPDNDTIPLNWKVVCVQKYHCVQCISVTTFDVHSMSVFVHFVTKFASTVSLQGSITH